MAEKMNPEVKARWVAALRSGAYKQTRKQLRSSGGFCCLGVLCDVLAPGDWMGVRHLEELSLPGQSIRLEAGFSSMDGFAFVPKVEIDGRTLSLDEHNDDGRTFAEIADAIEAQL